MPELYAVLMPRLTEMSIEVVAGIWVLLLLVLCALVSVANGPRRWIGRVLIVALIGAMFLWSSSVYAFVFLLFPANYFVCGWCWIW